MTVGQTPPAPGRRLFRVGPWDAFDFFVAVVLAVVSVVLRWKVLPKDGLFFDDAWVATSAIWGSWRDVLVLGTNHPGFTAALMSWQRLFGRSPERLPVPVLVFGSALAPLLYLASTRWFQRSISLILSICAAVATVHVMYSARAKSYAIDPVIILLVGVSLGPLCRRRWTWLIGAAWALAAIALGTFSVFALMATAAAGILLVVHGREDRIVRAMSVGVQGLVQIFYLANVQSRFASGRLTKDWDTIYDGYPELHHGASSAIRDLALHLDRAARVYPGGKGWIALLVALLAIAGLGIASWSGPNALRARFFGLLMLIGVVGGYAQVMPFGPTMYGALSGGRAMVWLIPSVAFGLAEVYRRTVGRLEKEGTVVPAIFTGVGVVLAFAIGFWTWGDASPYPAPGSGNAVAFVERTLAPGGTVVVLPRTVFPYAASTSRSVRLVGDSSQLMGFRPVFNDGSTIIGAPGAAVRKAVDGSQQVLVYDAMTGLSNPDKAQVADDLHASGLHLVRTEPFGWATVDVWSR